MARSAVCKFCKDTFTPKGLRGPTPAYCSRAHAQADKAGRTPPAPMGKAGTTTLARLRAAKGLAAI